MVTGEGHQVRRISTAGFGWNLASLLREHRLLGRLSNSKSTQPA